MTYSSQDCCDILTQKIQLVNAIYVNNGFDTIGFGFNSPAKHNNTQTGNGIYSRQAQINER